MDTEDINNLEEYIYKTNLTLYKVLMSKIKKEYNKIEVRDLGDYFQITQELNSNIQEYINQKKELNKIKETFKNHKK
jgi:hypothetical protein